MLTQIWDRGVFVYVVLVGACLGSFINVVLARLPHGASLVRPRSHCLACQVPIAWYDNVPIVSYMVLRGRCRRCHKPIPMRYWLIEVLMAGLAAALWVRLGTGWSLLVWLPLSTALVAITFLDIDFWWVPDVIVFPAMIWVVITCWLAGRPGPLPTVLGLLPALLLLGFGWAFSRIAGKEGLGLGDVKLLALLGLALGVQDVLAVLFLGSLQGAVLGGVIIAMGGHKGFVGAQTPAALEDDKDWEPDPHAVPFGPFLILAAFEVLLLPDLFGDWHQRIGTWLTHALS